MRALALLLALLACGPAAAQQAPQFGNPVVTYGGYAPTAQNASGVIAVTNTFQQLFAFTTQRKACTIQNQGTHSMYLYFVPTGGSSGNATTSTSLTVAPGQVVYCGNGVITLPDQVMITGTSGDSFFAAQQ